MKALEFKGSVISTISSKVDKSIRMSVHTGELSKAEIADVMYLQGISVDVLVTPTDEPEAEIVTIEAKTDTKSPGQRLRAVIWRVQEAGLGGPPTPSEARSYYMDKMEEIILHFKNKLD